MNEQLSAELAAKALADKLKIPSWKGSVFVWLGSDKPSLKVFVDKEWLIRSGTEVPNSFEGFDVEIDDRISGIAYDEANANRYA